MIKQKHDYTDVSAVVISRLTLPANGEVMTVSTRVNCVEGGLKPLRSLVIGAFNSFSHLETD